MASKKALCAAQKFREGRYRVAYRPRGTVLAGMNLLEKGKADQGSVCDRCKSLTPLYTLVETWNGAKRAT